MQARSLPPALEIRPSPALDAALPVPGSKSITNRALLCAALARGDSVIAGALASDDTEAMCEALGALGVPISARGDRLRVRGTGGHLRAPSAPLDARASGTTARFVTAAAALADGPVVVDGTPRMRERPIDDLVRALRQLGIAAQSLGPGGCPPVRVRGGRPAGGCISLRADRSSQFVSALLMMAPYAAGDVHIALAGAVVSRPYIDLTLAVMRSFGAVAGWRDATTLRVAGGGGYWARRYQVEPDASAATYAFAAAAIAGGRVRVTGLPADSLQPDLRFLDVLETMGCRVERDASGIAIAANRGSLRGVDVDMGEQPDAALTLAVVALFARGPTRIHNVANLRIKESDRLAALEAELGKLGARVCAGPDALRIDPTGARLRGAHIETHDDHRIAMACALAGLAVPGVVICNPSCVAKTWPDFFTALGFLRAHPPGAASAEDERAPGTAPPAAEEPPPDSAA